MSIKAPFSLYRKRFYYSIKNPQNPLFCFQFFVFNMHLNNFVKSNLYNMDDQIKQIAERLIGLRDALDIDIKDMAETCGVTEEIYKGYESGNIDIPVSTLHQISIKYGVDLSALMFGDEPRMNSYFLTRKGKGAAVERTKAYKYQSLAAGFMNRKADPFIVTVEPTTETQSIHLNTHPGQEFNLVLEGRVMLQIGTKELILDEGDSIYFDANRPHGMKALDGKPVKFLAIII